MNNVKETTATIYANVVKAWLKRGGVQSGKDLAYRVNQDPNSPLEVKNWFRTGDALVTTGFCVCVSQNLLNSKVFQALLKMRGAQAKLVSIDIKEMFFGVCKPSYVKNKWHTAIYVEDSGHSFIVDPTCAQFGNKYVGKLVWDFQTWCDTFRSATDRHTITDFNGDTLSFVNTHFDRVAEVSRTFDSYVKENTWLNRFSDYVALTDYEKEELYKFLSEGIVIINRKILGNAMQAHDIKYLKNISDIIFRTYKYEASNGIQYFLISFDNKEKQLQFVKKVINTGTIPVFGFMSDKMSEDSGLNIVLNDNESASQYHVLFRIVNPCGYKLVPNDLSDDKNPDYLVFEGTPIEFDPNVDIYNSGKNQLNKTNTVYIDCSIQY